MSDPTPAAATQGPGAKAAAAEFRSAVAAIEEQVSAAIVGQREAVRGVMISLILGGHALLEGVPGIGKTSMVRAFASALGITHSRIQFTPDLMPADITGTVVLVDRPDSAPQLVFQAGPLFGSLILADEINRASPRTQSALLEAMQEGTVTIGSDTHHLPRPFSVLATQNPVEMQGTYPLPEAQLDRFLLKLFFDYPSVDELTAIVRRTTEGLAEPAPVADGAALLRMGELARSLPAASAVLDYASRSVIALQPLPGADKLVRDYVRLGPSPRGAQALSLAGSVAALIAGRNHLSYDDVRAVALPALRHRLILTFDAERNGVTADDIVNAVIRSVPEDAP
ncbi:MAG TPA: MoxR family ATPase [Gaiellales bacterium]|nr:MoxR family ATPase [Gaiellales bacterium]